LVSNLVEAFGEIKGHCLLYEWDICNRRLAKIDGKRCGIKWRNRGGTTGSKYWVSYCSSVLIYLSSKLTLLGQKINVFVSSYIIFLRTR